MFYHKYKTDNTFVDTRRKITMEQRANIKFCMKLGKTFMETLSMLREAYGDKTL